MAGIITSRADYAVGQTLDISLNPKPSPFSDETQIVFNNAYDTKLTNSNVNNQGQCEMHCSLVQDESQKVKALGISGKLDFSYGPVSGDANVQFAMNNTKGSLDLTMIVRANQTNRIIKNDLNELIKLKLRESVKEKINNGNYTIKDFKKDYGSYLIFGFDLGGEIIFQSTYSTNSSADKMSVGGGLSLSYGKMGFNISGSVKGDYKSDDIKKSTNITTKYTINPSFDNDLINGDEGIIELLTKISDPLSNGVDINSDDDIKKNDSIGTMSADLYSKIQKLLGGKTLDAVNAVIYPMESIGCVIDEFSELEEEKFKIQSFFKFTNPLYMSMKEILKGLNTMNTNYDKYDQNNKPETDIILWLKSLQNNINKMQIIDGSDLYINAEKWYDYIHLDDDEKKDNDKQEIEKDFYKINKDVLADQFETKLFNQYNEMMKYNNPNNATLAFGCDDEAYCFISRDGGITFADLSVIKNNSKHILPTTELIENITSKTVLRFICQNDNVSDDNDFGVNPAAFISTIKFNEKVFVTPGHFKITKVSTTKTTNIDETKDIDVSTDKPLLYYPHTFKDGWTTTNDINNDAKWIWSSKENVTTIFEFNFKDIIDQ